MSANIVTVDEESLRKDIKNLVRKTVEETLNALLDEEASELVGAGRYERTAGREAYRSGHYARKLVTGAGEVELNVPKLRGATFQTAVIERYRRRETSVEEAIVEMYLAGVSTRRIEDVSELLWGAPVSSGTVSNLNEKAFASIEAWRQRPLEGQHMEDGMASSSSTKSGKANTFLWSFLEQGGSKAIQLFVQIILARLLSPEAFGILAILLVVTQITDSIAQSGLGMALIQKSDADDRSYSTAWWMSLGLAAALYIVVYFTSPTVSVFYNMPDLVVYLRVLGVIVFFNSANSIQRSYLQRNMNFRCIFAATTIAALISGFGGVVLAFFGFGVWSLVLQSLLQSIFICIVMWLQISWKPAFTFDVAQAWSLFSYGWKICITGILNVIYSGISELIIGRACSTSELGLYSQGRKYPTAAIGVMSNSIANVLFPMFSAIKGDSEALRGAIRRGLTLGTFLVAPISLLAAVVAKPLVAILLTEKWLACVPIFQLTCISNAILMIQLVNLRAYMALGDSSLYMRLQIIKVLGGGAIIWITAALTHDIYHTAWANFIVGVISIVFVDATPAKRLHGYSSLNQVKDVLPILSLSLVAAAASLAVQLLGLGYVPELFLQVILFASVYLGGAKLFKFSELSEAASLLCGFVSRRS